MGRIVVGVDGSGGSRAALRWAAEEARLRGADLDVVAAWQFPVYSVPAGVVWTGTLDWSSLAESTERMLTDLIAESAVAAEPGVTVRKTVVEGAPAPVLLEAASGADLLVLGARGHGGFRSLLLGSVSNQCVHHAPCPVVIVPAERP